MLNLCTNSISYNQIHSWKDKLVPLHRHVYGHSQSICWNIIRQHVEYIIASRWWLVVWLCTYTLIIHIKAGKPSPESVFMSGPCHRPSPADQCWHQNGGFISYRWKGHIRLCHHNTGMVVLVTCSAVELGCILLYYDSAWLYDFVLIFYTVSYIGFGVFF